MYPYSTFIINCSLSFRTVFFFSFGAGELAALLKKDTKVVQRVHGIDFLRVIKATEGIINEAL